MEKNYSRIWLERNRERKKDRRRGGKVIEATLKEEKQYDEGVENIVLGIVASAVENGDRVSLRRLSGQVDPSEAKKILEKLGDYVYQVSGGNYEPHSGVDPNELKILRLFSENGIGSLTASVVESRIGLDGMAELYLEKLSGKGKPIVRGNGEFYWNRVYWR